MRSNFYPLDFTAEVRYTISRIKVVWFCDHINISMVMGGIFENQSCFYDHISSHSAIWNTWKQWRKDARRRSFDREKSLINRQRRLKKRLLDGFGTQRPQVQILSPRPKIRVFPMGDTDFLLPYSLVNA